MNSEANIFQFFSIFMMAPNNLTANIFKLMFLKFENNQEKTKNQSRKKKCRSKLYVKQNFNLDRK